MQRNYAIIAGLTICAFIVAVGCLRTAIAQPEGKVNAQIPGSLKLESVLGTPDVSGLQMEVTEPTSTALLFAYIRNAGKRALPYNPCMLGYWEAVTLVAREGEGANWVRIPRRHLKSRGMESAGPRAYKAMFVEPGKVMLKTATPPENFLKCPSRFDYCSFCVDLNDFEWPQTLKAGKIQVKVEQLLLKSENDPNGTWAGTLSSGIITLDLKDLKM